MVIRNGIFDYQRSDTVSSSAFFSPIDSSENLPFPSGWRHWSGSAIQVIVASIVRYESWYTEN